ncbi:hypothetical protein EV182_001820, partial [Spiromyces aspiralis]
MFRYHGKKSTPSSRSTHETSNPGGDSGSDGTGMTHHHRGSSGSSGTLSTFLNLLPLANNRNSIFRVVIIGGAFGGIHAAKELERQCSSRQLQVTVIEKRDMYFYNPAALRAVAFPQIIPWLWLPYDHIFNRPKNRVIQGTVGAVLPNQVILTDGRVFFFDALVVATGSEYPKPSKMDTPSHLVGMREQFDFARKVREADSILIIGGGATGTEMAGEIATAYPKKRITIVQNSNHLLNNEGNAKFWDVLHKKLEILGVEIILNERVIIPEDDPLTYEIHPRWMKTTGGREIFSDLQFLCSGIQTRSEFMYSLAPTEIERIVNPQTGEIKVRQTMQLAHPYFPNIFAAGDCTNVPGQKLAGKADSQGKHCGACIAKMFKAWKRGRPNWKDIKLPTWEDPTYRIVISLGANAGVTHTPWVLLGSWATRLIKSKDLFLLKRYREFGLHYNPKWRKMVEEDSDDPFGAPDWCPPIDNDEYLDLLDTALNYPHISNSSENRNTSIASQGVGGVYKTQYSAQKLAAKAGNAENIQFMTDVAAGHVPAEPQTTTERKHHPYIHPRHLYTHLNRQIYSITTPSSGRRRQGPQDQNRRQESSPLSLSQVPALPTPPPLPCTVTPPAVMSPRSQISYHLVPTAAAASKPQGFANMQQQQQQQQRQQQQTADCTEGKDTDDE